MRFSGSANFGVTTSNPIVVTADGNAGLPIAPVFNSNADFSKALDAYVATLASGRIYGASIVGTAAAANKAIAELNNPNASGKIIYVYSLDVFVPVTMAINVLLAGTSLAPVGTGFNLSVGGAGGVAKVGGGNQLAPTGNLVYTSPTLAANATYFIPLQWFMRLPANTNIQLQGQTVNQAFTCNVRWVEMNT